MIEDMSKECEQLYDEYSLNSREKIEEYVEKYCSHCKWMSDICMYGEER